MSGRRHPAEVTATRLADAVDKWPDHFGGRERDMVGEIIHVLDQIADGAEPTS